MTDTLEAQLRQGCAALDLSLTDEQVQQLLAYLALIHKWNKVYNLTAVRDPQQMLSRHLLDSLAVIPHFSGADSVLDIGTGAGLPGIPLAICYPLMALTLLDCVAKKTRFLQQVKAELALNNVTVVTGRVEQVRLPKFAIITARAFATIAEIIDLAGRHCEDSGKLLLMKGTYPQQEIDALPPGYQVDSIKLITVPGSEAQRHLVTLIKD